MNNTEELVDLCKKKGIKIIEREKMVIRKGSWEYFMITVKSPNGYKVHFEGPNIF